MARTTSGPTIDESRRLAALRRFEILDTPPEQVFDDLTRLAAALCGTPISLLTLVDRDRQWFKSRHGLDTQETPRDIAFCAHAIHQDALLVVPDAHLDERFADNPNVTGEPGIRFYAGAPLVTSDGFELGTLCAIDRVPRDLSDEQLELLRALSRHATTLLDLRLRERLYRRFVELAPDGMAIVDTDGRVRYANARLAGFAQEAGLELPPAVATGPSADDPAPDRGDDAVDPDARPGADVATLSLWDLVADGTGTDLERAVQDVTGGRRFHGRARARLRAGSGARPVEVSVGGVELGGRPLAHLVVRDVSDEEEARQRQVDLAEQLHRAERLRMIGQLASGVAHNFNNLLTVILATAEMMTHTVERHLDDTSPAAGLDMVARDAERIAEAAMSAGQLTQQLLSLAGGRDGDDRPSDPVAVVARRRALLGQVAGDLVELHLDLAADVPEVDLGASHLEQILLNLVANARDAMPEGGQLVLRVDVVERRDAPVPQLPPPAPQRLVRCSLHDTGLGMTSEVVRRATEPFFTTRAEQGGSGLGLASVAAHVAMAGGVLDITSRPGQGTTVDVFLPPTARTVADRTPVRDAPADPPSDRPVTVLVVDDDDAVRGVMVRLLRRQGHRVEAAADAEGAIRTWRLLAGDVDALVTDERMPGMTGSELARWLRTERLDLPVVLVSGMPPADLGRVLPGPVPEVLDKPFVAEDLLAALRRVLTARHTT